MDCKEDSFTRFPDLPYELRSQIWEQLIPAHGIYLAECIPLHLDNNVDDDGRRTIQLVLWPAQHELFQVDGLRQRVRAQKTLLATCAESRRELCRHFPDTLGDRGSRLSFRHDLIYTLSNYFSLDCIGLNPHPKFRFEFPGGWNRLVHRMALNCEFCRLWFRLAHEPADGTWAQSHCACIKNLMGFLTGCTSLRQLFLTTRDGIGFDAWARLRGGERAALTESMTDCYGGLTCQEGPLSAWAIRLEKIAQFLRQVIADDLEVDIRPNWVGKIETGYPTLRDLEILKMVHVSEELRWLCKAL